MTLYEIDQALMDLMEAVDEETGEWAGDTEAWERLNLEREVKLENTACYLKDLRIQMNGIREEIRRLQRKLRTMDNKESWLMENLRRSLDGENFETTRCSMRFKRNPETVLIEDKAAALDWAEKWAPDAVSYKEPELRKSDLKTLFHNGIQVPGCKLTQDMRLEVK